MFKKPISTSGSHKLSGGDRKKIRKELQKQFQCSEEDVDVLLPLKGGELEVSKLDSAQKTQIYTLDKVPLILDTTCKNDLMPTLFALWKVPTLLPTIYLKHAAVSQYILGGADLMIPGVMLASEGLPKLRDWQLCCMAVPGNPAPIAIGRMLMDSAKATERVSVAAKGRLVQSLQFYQDKLHEFAVSAGAPPTPNAGFRADIVLPLDWDPTQQDADMCDSDSELEAAPREVRSTSSATQAIQQDWQLVDVTGVSDQSMRLSPEPHGRQPLVATALGPSAAPAAQPRSPRPAAEVATETSEGSAPAAAPANAAPLVSSMLVSPVKGVVTTADCATSPVRDAAEEEPGPSAPVTPHTPAAPPAQQEAQATPTSAAAQAPQGTPPSTPSQTRAPESPAASATPGGGDAGGLAASGGDVATRAPQVSAADMDDLLLTCLLQALHTRVTDKDLPMTGTALWATAMLPCRPPGQHLDVKASTYKKLSKFLQAQAKAGLLQVSEDKHTKEVKVQQCLRTCSTYRSFKPYKESALEAPATPAPVPGAKGTLSGKLTIEKMLRVGRELAPVFSATGQDSEAMYLAPQVTECLDAYVLANKLKDGSKDSIQPNTELSEALYKGLMKKGESYPERVTRAVAVQAMMRRMHPQNVLRRGDLEGIKKGDLSPVSITVVKRQGKKKVTIITGLETYLLDAATVSKDVKKVFACATAVEALAGQKKDCYSISVQGDVPAKVKQYLHASWGVPAELLIIKIAGK